MITLRIIFFSNKVTHFYKYCNVIHIMMEKQFGGLFFAFLLSSFFQICKYGLPLVIFLSFWDCGFSFKYNLVYFLSRYIITNLITQ